MTRLLKRHFEAALRFASRPAFSAGIRDHAKGVWCGDDYRDDEAMTYERGRMFAAATGRRIGARTPATLAPIVRDLAPLIRDRIVI